MLQSPSFKDGKLSGFLLSWILILLVLLLPRVVNHTETEDAYNYANQLKAVENFRDLIHPNHRIFHVLVDLVYEFQVPLVGLDPLGMLMMVSSVSSILTLFLIYFLFKWTGMSRVKATFACALLSVLYSYWRYTHAAEINALAWLFQTGAIYMLLRWGKSALGIFSFVLFCCVAVLIHTVCIVPVLTAAGVYYTILRKWKHLAATIVGSLALIFVSFVALDNYTQVESNCVSCDENVPAEVVRKESARTLTWKSFPKAVVGLGSCIISGNHVLANDVLYQWLNDGLFKDRYLYEERYLARSIPLLTHVFWWLLLCCTLILLYLCVKNSECQMMQFEWKYLMDQPPHNFLFLGTCLVSTIFVLWFEPGNPEMWTLLLVPIILPFLYISVTKCRISTLVCSYILIGGMNFLVGIMPLTTRDGDYYWATLNSISGQAQKGDVLLKASNHTGITRYMSYYYSDIEQNVWEVGLLETLLYERKPKSRVFIHQELFCVEAFMREVDFLGVKIERLKSGGVIEIL